MAKHHDFPLKRFNLDSCPISGSVSVFYKTTFEAKVDSLNPQIMTDEVVEVEGKIVSVLPGTTFRVELANKHQVLAHISGKLRKNFIKITVGDTVKMEMSPYDLNKARIVYRLRNADQNRQAPKRSFGPRGGGRGKR